MSKKSKWPTVKFLGKRTKAPAGLGDALNFGWELDYYEFLHKWNGGVPLVDSFRIKDPNGDDNVARVRYFYGISAGDDGIHDLRKMIVHNWDFLPRGAVPIGELDIEGFEFDLGTLLTFRRGDRFNRIYFFNSPHDFGPLDPDDPSRLTPLSSSLPQFLKSMKPFAYLCYRVWFQLPSEPAGLPEVENALVSAGADDFYDESDANRNGVARSSYMSDLSAKVWLVCGNDSLSGVRLPKGLPTDACYLAVDCFRWQHPAAQKHLRASLKTAGVAKQMRNVAETPVAVEPYWRWGYNESREASKRKQLTLEMDRR